MGEHPSYLWHMGAAVPYYDSYDGNSLGSLPPSLPHHPPPSSRNSVGIPDVGVPTAYEYGYDSGGYSDVGIPIIGPSPPHQEPPPVVRARAYRPPEPVPGPAPVPTRRQHRQQQQQQMQRHSHGAQLMSHQHQPGYYPVAPPPRSHSGHFRDVDYGPPQMYDYSPPHHPHHAPPPPPVHPPVEKPPPRTRMSPPSVPPPSVPPPPGHAPLHRFDSGSGSSSEGLRMPPPYRPPPEPPGRPSVPKPNQNNHGRPILGDFNSNSDLRTSTLPHPMIRQATEPPRASPPSPTEAPQAPPRRRHSQGNLQLTASESSPHLNRLKSTEGGERNHKRSSTVGRSVDNLDGPVDDLEEDAKISVRDRKRLFDSFSSENLLGPSSSPNGPAGLGSGDKLADKVAADRLGRRQLAESRASLGSHDPAGKQFTLACAVNDVEKIDSMLKEYPALASWRDPVTGYGAAHWAARKGNVDVLRILGTIEGFDVNARTSGGYTALHIAAQYNRDEFYEFLVGKLGADASLRDYSGKKPHQYRQKQETMISLNVLNKINVRKSQQQHDLNPKLLRLGSINVRVKKTAEALNHMIGGGNSLGRNNHFSVSSSSSSSSVGSEKRPHSVISLKSLGSNSDDSKIVRRFSSAEPSESPKVATIEEGESDFACGFGREWQN